MTTPSSIARVLLVRVIPAAPDDCPTAIPARTYADFLMNVTISA